MKKLLSVLILVNLFILGSCKNDSEQSEKKLPESSYLGEWKVTYTNDQKLVYRFLENEINIEDTNGQSRTLSYQINKKDSQYINFTEKDGETEITFTLHFPNPEDISTAVLLANVSKDEPLSDSVFAVMNRNEYIDYEPYYNYQEYLK